MGLTVNFDRHAPFEAGEIEHDLTQWMLAAKLVAARPLAQFAPDQDFRQIAGAALAFCYLESVGAGGEHPSTTLRAVPLPVPGRFWPIRAHLNLPVTGRWQREALTEGLVLPPRLEVTMKLIMEAVSLVFFWMYSLVTLETYGHEFP
jgi:hypothetical protein